MLRAIFFALVVLFVPLSVNSDMLSNEDLLKLYVLTVDRDTVAQRIGELVALVPVAQRPAAKATLKADLIAAVTAQAAVNQNVQDLYDQRVTDANDSDF